MCSNLSAKGVNYVSSNNKNGGGYDSGGNKGSYGYNGKNVRTNLRRLKDETSKELGIDLNDIDTLTTYQAGKVGGNMVRKMIDIAKNS